MTTKTITVADFSIEPLITRIDMLSQSNTEYHQDHKYLRNKGIANCEELINELNSRPEKFHEEIKKEIMDYYEMIKSFIAVADEKGYDNPKLSYSIPSCLTDAQKEIFNQVNEKQTADILPYKMPLCIDNTKARTRLANYSIAQAKSLAGCLMVNSDASINRHRRGNQIRNGLFLEIKISSNEVADRVDAAIRFHDDMIATQIINQPQPNKTEETPTTSLVKRQSPKVIATRIIETPQPKIEKVKCTLFDDLDQRRKAVAKQLVSIVKYILEKQDTYIWGETTNRHTTVYCQVLNAKLTEEQILGEESSSKTPIVVARTLVSYLAFYFPLDWIEDGLLNERKLTFVRDGEKVTDTIRPIDLLKKRIRKI